MSANLEQLRSAIAEAIDGMSPTDLQRHPEGKWSTAEILEHLNLTYIGTTKNLGRCLSRGQPLASLDRSKKRWQRLVVTRFHLYPPGRKSPEPVLPHGLPPERVRAEILENLAQLEKVITECEARFGSKKPIADHPILGPLTVQEWRGFHLAHGSHHLRQILRLKNS